MVDHRIHRACHAYLYYLYIDYLIFLLKWIIFTFCQNTWRNENLPVS